MASGFGWKIWGLQAAQDANLRAIHAAQVRGGLGRAVQYVLLAAHRYEVAITHVDTGSLRASQRIAMMGNRGMIYTDPNAVNPKSNQPVIHYAFVEHKRGYPHNYAERTVMERGRGLAQEAAAGIIDEIG